MDSNFFMKAAELGGTVFTVSIFIFYLIKKDTQLTNVIDESINAHKLNASSNLKLAKTLQKMTDIIEENIKVVKANTNVTAANTDIVIKNTNGNGKNLH